MFVVPFRHCVILILVASFLTVAGCATSASEKSLPSSVRYAASGDFDRIQGLLESMGWEMTDVKNASLLLTIGESREPDNSTSFVRHADYGVSKRVQDLLELMKPEMSDQENDLLQIVLNESRERDIERADYRDRCHAVIERLAHGKSLSTLTPAEMIVVSDATGIPMLNMGPGCNYSYRGQHDGLVSSVFSQLGWIHEEENRITPNLDALFLEKSCFGSNKNLSIAADDLEIEVSNGRCRLNVNELSPEECVYLCRRYSIPVVILGSP